LKLIASTPDISKERIAELLGIKEDGVKYHLNILKSSGIIKWEGPSRGGRWKILK
jgi:ATP-dependent DNA helicase RecG